MNRRTLDFRSFDEVWADVQALHQSGYQRAGNWSLGQICDHLAIFIRGSLDGFDRMMPWLLRATVGRYFLKKILRERRMKAGLRVPQKSLPGNVVEDAPAVKSFGELLDRYRTYSGPMHPSPIFGDLTRETWTDLHLVHASHHLSFLQPNQRSEDGY